MTAASPAPAPQRTFIVRQAAFIGVGSMVGAGIFSLLGAAGEIAGAAVWVSFLIAGGIALLQGYSFAKLGASYPSAAGMLEYVGRGFGKGHISAATAWPSHSLPFLASVSSRSRRRTCRTRLASCREQCFWRLASP